MSFNSFFTLFLAIVFSFVFFPVRELRGYNALRVPLREYKEYMRIFKTLLSIFSVFCKALKGFIRPFRALGGP